MDPWQHISAEADPSLTNVRENCLKLIEPDLIGRFIFPIVWMRLSDTMILQ
jgi:hypothetical protein